MYHWMTPQHAWVDETALIELCKEMGIEADRVRKELEVTFLKEGASYSGNSKEKERRREAAERLNEAHFHVSLKSIAQELLPTSSDSEPDPEVVRMCVLRAIFLTIPINQSTQHV